MDALIVTFLFLAVVCMGIITVWWLRDIERENYRLGDAIVADFRTVDEEFSTIKERLNDVEERLLYLEDCDCNRDDEADDYAISTATGDHGRTGTDTADVLANVQRGNSSGGVVDMSDVSDDGATQDVAPARVTIGEYQDCEATFTLPLAMERHRQMARHTVTTLPMAADSTTDGELVVAAKRIREWLSRG